MYTWREIYTNIQLYYVYTMYQGVMSCLHIYIDIMNIEYNETKERLLAQQEEEEKL